MTTSIDIFNQTNINKLNMRPDTTSLVQPLNNDINDRFNQNRLLNGKTRYEETNTIIKSLEEEIVNMKHKLSFVYEKDEEICKLKDTIISLKNDNKELEVLSNEVVKLRLENKQLTDELMDIKNNQIKNKTISNKIINNQEIFEDIDIIEDIEDIEEYIEVDIPKLRNILMLRLKNKQISHINSLISMYGLNNKRRVCMSEMKELLEQAIHI
jgi:hypothetical protein